MTSFLEVTSRPKDRKESPDGVKSPAQGMGRGGRALGAETGPCSRVMQVGPLKSRPYPELHVQGDVSGPGGALGHL